MNDVHLHLAVNHFPIIGVIIGAITLGVSVALKEKGIRKAGLGILVFSAIMAIPAFLTGEGAEEVAEEIAGVSHDLIHEHEEQAESFLWLTITTGVLALFALILDIRNHKRAQALVFATLLIAVMSIYLGREVGVSGGEIRHPEIHEGWVPEAGHEHG